jgi:hypothetical protein
MGAIDTTSTFTATDVITSTKMNNILDQSTITATAITGTTLAVTTGKLSVAAGGIRANELAANAVTTTAILDANVTPAKLSNSDFGDFTVASGVATIDAGVVTTAKILDANITAAKLSGAQTGTAPIYGIRAWVKFDASGNIIKSGNVSSVFKNSVGVYTITMTTAMPDTDYVIMGTVQRETVTARGGFLDIDYAFTKTTTQVKVRTILSNTSDPGPGDCSFAYVAIIR